MEHWRQISLTGIILGLAMQTIDAFIVSIPYIIIIPLDIAALILIFCGLLLRKRISGQQNAPEQIPIPGL